MDNTQIIEQHTERLFELEKQQAVHQNTFESINQTLQRMDSRLDRMDSRLERMEEKADLLSGKIESLSTHMTWVLRIGGTVCFLILSMAFKYFFMPGIA